MGSQRVGHEMSDFHFHFHFHFKDVQLPQAVEEGIMFNFMSKTVKWVLQDNF